MFESLIQFLSIFFFFFQAEDGIRDVAVTGVQTCALPISTQGEMQTPAAGSGTPSSRSATSVATVRPPPAESPATTRLAGACPRARSHPYAATAASSAAGNRGAGGRRESRGSGPPRAPRA